MGDSPEKVAQYPNFNGQEKSLVFNPVNQLYYFIRDGKVYEYSPQTTRTSVVSDEPVTTVTVSDNGDVLFATSNRQV